MDFTRGWRMKGLAHVRATGSVWARQDHSVPQLYAGPLVVTCSHALVADHSVLIDHLLMIVMIM